MEEHIIQDGIDYKIVDGVLKGWKGTSPFQKPFYNGVSIEEGWTQADEDGNIEQQELLTVADLLQKFESDGVAFFHKIRTLIQYWKDKGNISDVQFTNIRDILRPAIAPLRIGEWDEAKVNVDALTRPSGVLGQLYDFVKTGIDDYLLT